MSVKYGLVLRRYKQIYSMYKLRDECLANELGLEEGA